MEPWQLEALASLRRLISGRVSVHGSVLTPDLLDGWSDLDATITTEVRVAAGGLLDAPIWAAQQAHDERGQLLRLVTVDGRRFDLRATGAPMLVPELPVDNAIRFDAALAATRLGRGNALIGLHLVMGILREALVLRMVLADRTLGTTHHRHATRQDDDTCAAQAVVARALEPTMALDAYNLYAQWRRVNEPDYRPDPQGLVELIRRGAADHTSTPT